MTLTDLGPNDKLYYTDSNRSEVGCCDINGTTLWTFTDTSVSKDQRSIAVDEYGNVSVVSVYKFHGSSDVKINKLDELVRNRCYSDSVLVDTRNTKSTS
jgi:hypothetical protein